MNHTADITYKIEANSLEELIELAVKGMYDTFINTQEVEENKEIEIKIEAPHDNIPRLIFSTLNEFIYLLDTKLFIFKRFKSKKIESKNGKIIFKGVAEGDILANKKYKVESAGVKAPTYHNIKIQKKGKKWIGNITLDI